MTEIRRTDEYRRWFEEPRDRQARFRILARIRSLSLGNPGDVAVVGEGVPELRIDCGPGCRVCFRGQSETLVVLLAGGSKRTQKRDIEKAKELAREL